MKTLQVITLGCSKNTVDTEHLLYQVRNAYEIVPEGEERDRVVDVLLINTCGFIGDAKEESVNAILAAVAAKKEGRYGKLLVFGCLSERYGRELPDLIPEVDGWFGARDLAPVVRALGCEPSPDPRRVLTRPGLPYAFLKISEGCDRHCSYCAIPLIRGRHRSVPMETLVEEAEALAAAGVRELVIIAQDTSCCGAFPPWRASSGCGSTIPIPRIFRRMSSRRWRPIPRSAATWTFRCSISPTMCCRRCAAAPTVHGPAT